MTGTGVFCTAVTTADTLGLPGPRQLGSRLAWAAAHTLHAQGADIILAADHSQPTPWGASNPTAALAEQHQFSADDGPSLAVLDTGRSLRATHTMIERAWPCFAAALAQHTPYRSILAVPMA